MTGVTSAPWRESFEFDRHDVSYLKVTDSAEKFAVVQVGVCPFRWDSERLVLVAQPEQANKLRRQLDEPSHIRHNFIDSKAVQTVSIVDMLFTERMKDKIKKWRDRILQYGTCWTQLDQNSSYLHRFETTFFGTRPALALSGFTAYQLRLIRLILTKYFEDLQFFSISAPDFQVKRLLVFRDSVSDKELLMNDVDDENRKFEEIKINSFIGFHHVIDLLSSKKKCIIGHNCFLDIAHIYRKFFGTLPQDVEDFVTSVNKYFPHIIDTKVISHSNLALQRRMGNFSTSLSSAFAKLCPQLKLRLVTKVVDPICCLRGVSELRLKWTMKGSPAGQPERNTRLGMMLS